MKIVIFGANGKTGSLLVEQALANGDEVIAFIRTAGSILLDHPKLKIVVGNLTEKLKLKDVITGSDACISALGGSSLTHHSEGIMNGIDNIVSIMEQVGVSRFIYLSSFGAGESLYYMPQPIRFIIAGVFLRVPLADHNTNEQRISKSTLHWTIVRPGSLTDGPQKGDLKHGNDKFSMKGNSGISRASVAAFMLLQLSDNQYVNKSVWLFE
ncbi:MAG: NAD(P)-dependent oxidoreductase [Paludibacter sp.]